MLQRSNFFFLPDLFLCKKHLLKVEKQENQNKENPSQTFNTQLNFLMENELNAIGKLPKDLADRIVTMLEKSLEYKKITIIKY